MSPTLADPIIPAPAVAASGLQRGCIGTGGPGPGGRVLARLHAALREADAAVEALEAERARLDRETLARPYPDTPAGRAARRRDDVEVGLAALRALSARKQAAALRELVEGPPPEQPLAEELAEARARQERIADREARDRYVGALTNLDDRKTALRRAEAAGDAAKAHAARAEVELARNLVRLHWTLAFERRDARPW